MRNKKINLWLRLENLLIFLLSLFLYWYVKDSWWLFILLFLFPDIAFLGLFVSKRFTAGLYNVLHNFTIPIILLFLAEYSSSFILAEIGLIWISHIALDRAVGYWLKNEKLESVVHT